jgi:hypothetical protein
VTALPGKAVCNDGPLQSSVLGSVVVHRFVPCLGAVRGREPASLLEGVFQQQTF